MEHVLSVRINLDPYRAQLERDLDRTVVTLRTVLRSLEDGTYEQKFTQPRAGGVVTFEASAQPAEQVSQAEVLDAFLAAVRALIDFIDKMVAVSELTFASIPIPVDQQISSEAELLAYATGKINEAVESAIRKVAVDTRLTNPKKVSKLVVTPAFSNEACRGYFALRRAIEHHKGVPEGPVEVPLKRLRFSVEGQEVTSLPFRVETAGRVTAEVVDYKKVFDQGKRIVLTEEDLENVVFTIRFAIAPEIANATAVIINRRLGLPN